MAKPVNLRELALETLLVIRKEHRQSHLFLREVCDAHRYLPARDRAFLVRLVEGTLENQILLDYCIDQFSRTRTGKMKPQILEILRLSVYQILFMDSVPDSAAVNEAVRLTAGKGFHGLKGFVNGVLRSISRGRDQIRYPDRSDGKVYIHIRYSIPEFLTESWIREFGLEQTEAICRSFLDERPVTVRLRGGLLEKIENTPEEKREAQLEELTGCTMTKAPYAPDCWYLKGAGDIGQIPAFQSGEMTVQDVSSNLAVRAARPCANETVLDLCAAPGGKSLLAYDLMEGEGSITARDLTEIRTERIRENIRRLGAESIRTEEADALIYDPEWEGKADLVIADLPCTGYGVIGKKPDIKYNASPEKQAALAELQREILENAVRYVKPGGRLLYSTCTFGTAENQDNVRYLLEKFPAFEPVSLTDRLPAELLALPFIAASAPLGYAQLLSGVCACDGFFIALFQRKKEDI